MHLSCIICTELFTIDSHVAATACGHIFHFQCLDTWCKQKTPITCPQCRNELTTEKIIQKIYLNESELESDDDLEKKYYELIVAKSELIDKHKNILAQKETQIERLNKQNERLIHRLEDTNATLKQKEDEVIELKSTIAVAKTEQDKLLERIKQSNTPALENSKPKMLKPILTNKTNNQIASKSEPRKRITVKNGIVNALIENQTPEVPEPRKRGRPRKLQSALETNQALKDIPEIKIDLVKDEDAAPKKINRSQSQRPLTQHDQIDSVLDSVVNNTSKRKRAPSKRNPSKKMLLSQ